MNAQERLKKRTEQAKARKAKQQQQTADRRARSKARNDEQRAKRVELRQTRLEDQQKRTEELRRQKFGEAKLKEAERKDAEYRARRERRVELATTKLEDAKQASDDIREQWGWDEEQRQEKKEKSLENSEAAIPPSNQPEKEDGSKVGKIFESRLEAQREAVMAAFQEVMENIDHGWNGMLAELSDYDSGAASIVNSYSLPEQLADVIALADAIGKGNAIRIFGRGKFADQS